MEKKTIILRQLETALKKIKSVVVQVASAAAQDIAAHNADEEAHNGLTARVQAMETRLDDMDDRLYLLELMYKTDKAGNPFAAAFETLAGLEVTGVWNTAQKRIEF